MSTTKVVGQDGANGSDAPPGIGDNGGNGITVQNVVATAYGQIDGVEIKVTYGTIVFDDSFATLSAAGAFFTSNTVDIGAETGAVTPIPVALTVTTSGVGVVAGDLLLMDASNPNVVQTGAAGPNGSDGTPGYIDFTDPSNPIVVDGGSGSGGGNGDNATANEMSDTGPSTAATAIGGAGGNGGNGGNGTDPYAPLMIQARGGAGGDGGNGGAAQALTDTSVEHAAETATATATATGGNGGAGGYGGYAQHYQQTFGNDGNGGGASASASATNALGAAVATGTATGGSTGGGFLENGNGGSASATAIANGGTTATAIASATGGAGALQPDNTQYGAEADANASASSGTGQALAETSTFGVGDSNHSSANATGSADPAVQPTVFATAIVPGDGATATGAGGPAYAASSVAAASVGSQSLAGFTAGGPSAPSSATSYAYAVGAPTNSYLASIGDDVAALVGAGNTAIGAAILGANETAAMVAVEGGSIALTSTASFQPLAEPNGELVLDLVGYQAYGGVDGVEIRVTLGTSSVVLDDSFATLAAAEAFFTRNTVDVGARASPGELITVNLIVTTSQVGGFAANLLLASATVIPPNGPPQLAAPATALLGVGRAGALGDITLSETGTTTGEVFTVTVTDTNGLLSATGAPLSEEGTTRITLTGSLAQVNADLATLTDTNPQAQPDTVTIAASDSLGGHAQAATIAVGVNGRPAILLATTVMTIVADETTRVGGIVVSEAGDTSGESFTVTISDPFGALSATGPGVSFDGNSDLILTGSLAQVNADLATLTVGQAAGQNTITVAVTDGFGNVAAPQTVAVTAIAPKLTLFATSYAAGPNPIAVTAAYLAHNGLDLIVADLNGGVSILFAAGGRTLTVAAGPHPDAVTTADLTGEGNLDLIVADGGGGVSVLLGNGHGGFGPATTYAAGSRSISVAAADLNGDGHPDLVVADANGGVSALLGDGRGGFGPATVYAAGLHPYSITVADLNHDGRQDIIAADLSGGVSVLLGDGQGGFAPARSYAAGNSPIGIASADLNGDGQIDLVVADANGGMSVLLGDGHGGFGAPTTYTAGPKPYSVSAADINRDGRLDLVVTDRSGAVYVLLNNGDGFGPATVYSAGLNGRGGIAAGDGYFFSEIVVANLSGGVSVLQNTAVVPLVGDGRTLTLGDGDNVVDVEGGANVVNVGLGHNTIDVHGDGNAIFLSGGYDSVTLAGQGNTVHLGTDPIATLLDAGTGLTVYAGQGFGQVTLEGVPSDPSFVLDLLGGAGGFATGAAAYAALLSDGNGGSVLGLGGLSSVDFAGVTVAHLSATNFHIG